jgi:hypothetical protein
VLFRSHALDLPLQINTLVTDETLVDLPAAYQLMTTLGIMRWSLFFLISMGRGASLAEIRPAESERLNLWLYGRSKTAPFQIKTTEATHYRRVAIKRMVAEGLDEAAMAATSVGRGFGVRDGNGIMFIAYDGSVHPSGFLPVRTGNVRTDDLVTLYRNHVTDAHRLRRFGAGIVQVHEPAGDGIGGDAARFEEARRPQPAIETHLAAVPRFLASHIVKCHDEGTRCTRSARDVSLTCWTVGRTTFSYLLI